MQWSTERPPPVRGSTLETVAIASRDRRVVYWTTNHLEAPGWSRDAQWFYFTSHGRSHRLPAAGGEPEPIDTAVARVTDYPSDGQFTYFSFAQNGTTQIWRRRPDGSAEAVTSGDLNNAFPHPSPDRKWILFQSYEKQAAADPGNKQMTLRLLPAKGGPIEVLARFVSGQEPIDSACWSPDSRKVVFISSQPE